MLVPKQKMKPNTIEPYPAIPAAPKPHRRVPVKALLFTGLALIFFTALGYTFTYMRPSHKTFSYAGGNCTNKPTFLPQLHKLEASRGVKATFINLKSLAGYPIFAEKLCINITQVPRENSHLSVAVRPLSLPLIKHTTLFASGEFPTVTEAAQIELSGLISTRDAITLPLNKADKIFTYKLAADGKSTPCAKNTKQLKCEIADLQLAQAHTYEVSVKRFYQNKELEAVLTNEVQTVSPITVTDTSIKPNSMVYDSPSNLVISFDKPLASHEEIKLATKDNVFIAFSAEKQDNKLVVTFREPLPRNTQFTLAIDEVHATDEGFMPEPFLMGFSTSGGPKVVSKSIGSYDVAANAIIRLTFDTTVATDAAKFITLTGNGGTLAATITASNNVVSISPTRNFERCESFTVMVAEGLKNVHGITGGTAYKHTARSTCRSVFSIGKSAEGRAITAYKFGSGSSAILYVGGTHGNEISSKIILDSWVSHLESVAPSIPAHRSIIVIPSVNPDGIARKNRPNARNVDLNRNFPSNNWKADVTNPSGQLVVNGGGTTPLSEPESDALASYTLSLKPRLVLTYHAKGSIVTANESDDSMDLAIYYGRKTGYWAVAESKLGNTFNYDTTGAYENWLHDKAGFPVLLIELPDHSSNYFSSNQSAMWHMATLP